MSHLNWKADPSDPDSTARPMAPGEDRVTRRQLAGGPVSFDDGAHPHTNNLMNLEAYFFVIHKIFG